ncbi:MAG: hypothetical protein M1838_004904 [Thelocarpon superellum]|nr:MAG: hypothetical protein M1838_004904 [Thelocarpon superellum]
MASQRPHSPRTSVKRASPSPDPVDDDIPGESDIHAISPAPSSAASLNGHVGAPVVAGDPPVKRRKLTVSEKEEKRRSKDEAEKAKAEQRAKREEAKRVKEDERRQKEEEKRRKDQEREVEKRRKDQVREEKKNLKEEEKRVKEEEKRAKEEEKRAKEEEKKIKEEEKLKKEKAQLRLNAFFVRPTTSSPETSRTAAGRGASFLGSSPIRPNSREAREDASVESGEASSSPSKRSQSDYERTFPPFFLQSHVSLAPYPGLRPDEDAQQAAHARIDACLEPTDAPAPAEEALGLSRSRHALRALFIRRRRTPLVPTATTKQLVEKMLESATHPVDLPLTDESHGRSASRPEDVLQTIPVKVLQFAEDVRPPYRGTYSKRPPASSSLARGRNPFQRALPDTNYDYDSEAEWEEPDPEDGEDLDSEGEDDGASEEDGEDLHDFLDDEGVTVPAGTAGGKRRVTGGDLEPVCSGLCWADERGDAVTSEERSSVDVGAHRLELIPYDLSFPIDPFALPRSTMPREGMASSTSALERSGSDGPVGAAQTSLPRMPLHAVKGSSAASNPMLMLAKSGLKGPGLVSTQRSSAKPHLAQKRLIGPDDMENFRLAVQGSDLTKAGLIEVLKKRFPKASKDAIRDTLMAVATRVGAREAEKRWTLTDSQ